MADKQKNDNKTLQTFLDGEFFEDTNSQIPEDYKLIKKYPLLAPFSYANILYDEKKSKYLYKIDEVKLNNEETEIFHKIRGLIEENLDCPENIKHNVDFDNFLDGIIRKNEKIFKSKQKASIEKVKYQLHRDIRGFSVIDPLMHDVNIEDISCSGVGDPLYIWHRHYESIPTNIKFDSHDVLNSFVSRIVFKAGKHVSGAFPITDLALEGNHRLSVLYQKEITPKGTSFTIRKFKEDPYTLIDLINFGTVDTKIVAYLWMLMEAKASFIVVGSTGGGKTTILNSILGLVHPDHKIFSVEDVSEINLEHENWFALLARSGFGAKGEGEIGLFDLIKAGVRHRPDYIAVGEIRGSEAYVMFQAMATGHGGVCTIHADSLESAFKRLKQKPMDIPGSYVSLMNCGIMIKRVKDLKTNQSMRRAVNVTEIVDENKLNRVFWWNPKNDSFDSDIENSVQLKKIATATGQSIDDVIDEYQNRVQVIKWMVDNDIRQYKDVAQVLGKYYRVPDSILQKIHMR